jgi:DNA-binding SARP family transcriptional activator/TolB-like protein
MTAAQPIGTGEPPGATAAAPDATLLVSLFGGCSFHFSGRELPIANKKGKALLGYLAFAHNHSETRERLVGMFWSEMAEDKARANLRQTLHSLRDTLEAAGFEGFNTLYSDPGFEPGTVKFDAIDALDSVARDWPTDHLVDRARVADTLFAGFEDIDPSFRNWLAVQRESLTQKLIRELQDRLSANPAATPVAKRLALALLQLDPTHEPACRCVMRAHADAGDAAGAIAAYNRLCGVLESEHDQPPDQATADLVVAIKDGSYRPAVTVAARASQGIVSLFAQPALPVAPVPSAASEKLVLIIGNFAHIGHRKELTFAFRHELISRLTRFREWQLVDGDLSTPSLLDNAPSYTLLAPLMEGEHDLNLFLSLKETRTGAVLWSERFNIELKNFFPSLQDVMRQIAAKLNVYISVERLNRIAAAPDVSLEIYDRWLLGQSLIYGWQPSDRPRLASVLQSIIAVAPNFSPAYSAVAQQKNTEHIVLPGIYRTVASQQDSLQAAKTAVRLDPLDSRAQLALAWSQAFVGNFDLAISGFDNASNLNENDPWTMTSVALGYAYGDQLKKAAATARGALELTRSPMPLHWCYQSTVRFMCGDFEGCAKAAAQAGESISYLLAWHAAALALSNQPHEAKQVGRRFAELTRASWFGEADASDAAIARWLLHCFPIRNPAALSLLRQGLEKAGLSSHAA